MTRVLKIKDWLQEQRLIKEEGWNLVTTIMKDGKKLTGLTKIEYDYRSKFDFSNELQIENNKIIYLKL